MKRTAAAKKRDKRLDELAKRYECIASELEHFSRSNIIAHYACAMMNWEMCLDELIPLREENQRLRARLKKLRAG